MQRIIELEISSCVETIEKVLYSEMIIRELSRVGLGIDTDSKSGGTVNRQ